MTDFMEATPSSSKRPDEIESEIRRTRERMGDEVAAIGDHLRPARIKQRATEAVKRKGANLFRTAKENPVPTAIVALGLTLLFRARSKQRQADNGYSESGSNGHGFKEKTQALAGDAREKAQQVVGAAGEKIGHAAEQVSQKAKSTGYTLENFFERNPIIAGAGAIVLGAAVGALIPETQKEKKLMGHARDQIVDKTKSVVQQAQGAIEQKLSEHPQEASYGSYQR